MPLTIISEDPTESSMVKWWQLEKLSNDELLNTVYTRYSVCSNKFLEQNITVVPPEGLLYVAQAEMAVCSPQKQICPIKCIGSGDATTCHILIARHAESGITLAAHLDSADNAASHVKKAEEHIVQTLQLMNSYATSAEVDLYVVGGYVDDTSTDYMMRNISAALSCALLRSLEKCTKIMFNLKLACISRLNTKVTVDRAFPAIYGIACDLATGQVFPAEFSVKEPLMELRTARLLSMGGQFLLPVFDCVNNQFVIERFNYVVTSEMKWALEWPDNDFLESYSSSPKVEPPDFLKFMRMAMQFMINHPKPLESIFKEGKLVFDMHDGRWRKHASQ